MKKLALYFLFCAVAYANVAMPVDFPAEPTATEVLEKNGFSSAGEDALLLYLRTHWEDAGYWIPDVTIREQEQISHEYFRRVEARDVVADEYLKTARAQLEMDRLVDPRRIVDAIIRKLGSIGTGVSLIQLFDNQRFEEREWVNWKALASVEEILPRVNPVTLDERLMIHVPANVVAPLLRDIDPAVADRWAWALWERQKKSLSTSFRSHVRLITRIWLARAFAGSHPQEASAIFSEGLQSQDASIRVAAQMIIRSGIGGSLPDNTSGEQLARAVSSSKWNLATRMWETLPLPLERPLLRKLIGGREDLIWLAPDGKVAKSKDDVWPLIREPLGDGNFYSEIGDTFPKEYGLSDGDGILFSRIRNLWSLPTLAFHGGLSVASGYNRIAEFQTDGSVLWECRVKEDCRQIVPIGGGRMLLLGRQFLECRDRRGDLLWEIPLKGLGDPRFIVPVADDRFLVSCGKSVGWLSRNGKYDPILSNFISSGWIRYHPTEPWIILEGRTAVIYDPESKKELGRVDLDDGWGSAKSRFSFPAGYFPE